MKKIVIVAVSLLCLCGTAAAQRHIEYQVGVASILIIDGSYVMNINRTPGAARDAIADTLSGFMPRLLGRIPVPQGSRRRPWRHLSVRPHGCLHADACLRGVTQPPHAFEAHPLRRLAAWLYPSRGRIKPHVTKIETGGLYFGPQAGGRFAIRPWLCHRPACGLQIAEPGPGVTLRRQPQRPSCRPCAPHACP